MLLFISVFRVVIFNDIMNLKSRAVINGMIKNGDPSNRP